MNEANVCDVSLLLRDPGAYAEMVRESDRLGRVMVFLGAVTLLGIALFGLSLGFFVDWKVACVDALKLTGALAFAFLLCTPALYVFSAICGSTLNPLRLVSVGLICTATLSSVLAGLAPIVWLFAVSTESVAFVTHFAVALGGIAVALAVRPIARAAARGVIGNPFGIVLWLFFVVIVTFQGVTLVRPMLEPLGAERPPAGKTFFIKHLVDVTFESSK